MVKLAIQDNDAFALDDRETHRPGPTYTVDTLEQLHAERTAGSPPSGRQSALPGREAALPAAEGGPPPLPSSLFPLPYLLLGSDALADLPHWKSPDRIKQLAQIIIAPRPGFDIASSPYPVIDMPLLEISSTLVRARVAAGKPIRYLVPPAVETYIHDHALYR
jgi:nicotinate-nucleotide adenylyltransferase